MLIKHQGCYSDLGSGWKRRVDLGAGEVKVAASRGARGREGRRRAAHLANRDARRGRILTVLPLAALRRQPPRERERE
jgi:hypothetical protein